MEKDVKPLPEDDGGGNYCIYIIPAVHARIFNVSDLRELRKSLKIKFDEPIYYRVDDGIRTLWADADFATCGHMNWYIDGWFDGAFPL